MIGSLCPQDGKENPVGFADGRMELHDQILQEQLLGWVQTGERHMGKPVFLNLS